MDNTVVAAVTSVTVMGFLSAVILAVASKVMAVFVDERVTQVRECLPGANCGACGFSGCDGYAEALINEGARTNLCIPGGEKTSRDISEVMGVDFAGVAALIAVVHCKGDNNVRLSKMEYRGISTCVAAKQLYGGQNACTYGCLGFGDCAAVCPNDAICIEDGLARVDMRKCTGCGLCSSKCPNKLISVEDSSITTAVLCKNTERASVVRAKCASGCNGCNRCVRACPNGAIVLENFLARIDYTKCDGCGKCAEECSTDAIQLLRVGVAVSS